MAAWFPRPVAFSILNSRRSAGVAVLAMLAGACTGMEPRQDGFERTGEVLAMSGGDAGVRGACVTCHGLQGQGDGNLAPRLAGLDPGYFARQMEYYSKGMRSHPQMSWIAKRLDGPAREKLARYYAQLPLPISAPAASGDDCVGAVLYHKGDPGRGIEPCASCHGDDGQGRGLGNPPVADQPAPYLEEQLRRWRDGERYGDPQRSMTRIAGLLTPAEARAVSGYNPARRGATSYPESLAACLRTRRPDPRSGA